MSSACLANLQVSCLGASLSKSLYARRVKDIRIVLPPELEGIIGYEVADLRPKEPSFETDRTEQSEQALLTMTDWSPVACVISPSNWPFQTPYAAMSTSKHSREVKPFTELAIAWCISIDASQNNQVNDAPTPGRAIVSKIGLADSQPS